MSVKLSVRHVGEQGPHVVMLHGWGLNSSLFEHSAELLKTDCQSYLYDLPGHGLSAGLKDDLFDLASIAHAVLQQAPERFILLGWSMGGLIAQYIAAHFPERVEKLILVAANACFVQQADWPGGMKPEVLAAFSDGLEQDYQATIQRFLSLQARGGEQAREVIRQMRERVFARGEPLISALRGGLALLKNENRIADLNEINCPVLLVYGDKDMLVPVQAGIDMAQRLSKAQLVQFSSAAHAPFLTHADEFVTVVKKFLNHE